MKLTTQRVLFAALIFILLGGGVFGYFVYTSKRGGKEIQQAQLSKNENTKENPLANLVDGSYVCSAKFGSQESKEATATVYYKQGNLKYEMEESKEDSAGKYNFLILGKNKKAYMWDDSGEMAFQFEFDLSKAGENISNAKGLFSNFDFNIKLEDLASGKSLSLEDLEKSINGKCEFKDVPSEVFELPSGITFNKSPF